MPNARAEKVDEAYRSIGEAAKMLGLPTHVLRYWETKFPRYVRPVKRPDGRRLYRQSDLESLRAIQTLVHRRGMTLKGAKALLAEQGISAVLNDGEALGAMLTGSPVHALQKTVVDAFSAAPHSESMASETDRPPQSPQMAGEVAGSRRRLEAALEEMDALKARIDAALSDRAA